ncbi:MAG: hypothetical protein L6428_03075 [Candidatus Aminicenantes bacterium]|nr:hypothetical protein [Acidobacteriota bacterium]MCG2810426.1 hypothetical protein [Candidatus Aminicenantes bacterium]
MPEKIQEAAFRVNFAGPGEPVPEPHKPGRGQVRIRPAQRRNVFCVDRRSHKVGLLEQVAAHLQVCALRSPPGKHRNGRQGRHYCYHEAEIGFSHWSQGCFNVHKRSPVRIRRSSLPPPITLATKELIERKINFFHDLDFKENILKLQEKFFLAWKVHFF